MFCCGLECCEFGVGPIYIPLEDFHSISTGVDICPMIFANLGSLGLNKGSAGKLVWSISGADDSSSSCIRCWTSSGMDLVLGVAFGMNSVVLFCCCVVVCVVSGLGVECLGVSVFLGTCCVVMVLCLCLGVCDEGVVFLEVCDDGMLAIAISAAVVAFSVSRFAPRRFATIMANPDRREARSDFFNVIVSSTDLCGLWTGAGVGAGAETGAEAGRAQKPSIRALWVLSGAALGLWCLCRSLGIL